MTAEIERQWAPYSDLLPIGDVTRMLEVPLGMAQEQVELLLPSIVLGTDGPKVDSLFFLTRSLLGEARLSSESHEFDFVSRHSVLSARFSLRDHSVQSADGSMLRYQLASVTVLHTDSIYSTLHYAGRTGREQWLQALRRAIPLLDR